MTTRLREVLARRSRKTARRRFWAEHDREEHTCPNCGFEGNGEPHDFEVHHRDGDWLNNHPMNLVALCWSCHRRLHRLEIIQGRLDSWKDSLEDLGGASA